MARRQSQPVVEVVLARRARLAPHAAGHVGRAEREDPRVDRLLESSVAPRQLRGDRATMLALARHRRALHQHRRGLVAVVAGAGPRRGVKDDEVISHGGASYERRTRALPCLGQIAKATRGRDLLMNVPLPRKPPDLLMAESPPTGGLSAFYGPVMRRGRASTMPTAAGTAGARFRRLCVSGDDRRCHGVLAP